MTPVNDLFGSFNVLPHLVLLLLKIFREGVDGLENTIDIFGRHLRLVIGQGADPCISTIDRGSQALHVRADLGRISSPKLPSLIIYSKYETR